MIALSCLVILISKSFFAHSKLSFFLTFCNSTHINVWFYFRNSKFVRFEHLIYYKLWICKFFLVRILSRSIHFPWTGNHKWAFDSLLCMILRLGIMIFICLLPHSSSLVFGFQIDFQISYQSYWASQEHKIKLSFFINQMSIDFLSVWFNFLKIIFIVL